MRTSSQLPASPGSRRPLSRRSERAVTITEMMIVVSLLMMVLTAVLTTHLFGLRFFEITKAKLVASDDARRTISRLVSEIRGAKIVRIGNGDLATFTEVADGLLQQGTAIQVYATTNTNTFVRYYWSSVGKLRRTTNNATGDDVMASSVTNSLIFTSENYAGTVLTNNQNNRVIGVTLKFKQLAYPVINIGSSNYYDFYQLRLRVTRRVLE